MANVVGEQFEEYVQKQINVRQKAHGSGVSATRTPEEITYLNSKTAWVKLASGVTIDSERVNEEEFRSGLSGVTLAKNYILFGGVSRLEGQSLTQRGLTDNKDNVTDFFDGTYNVTANKEANSSNYTLEFGLTPMPGIISAEIKHKNRGSIKEATVKIKAYNREQFDIINVLYLRLGYTVLLEWGNSLYLNNESKLTNTGYTLTEWEYGFFGSKYKTHLKFLPLIGGFRKGKDANYDGLLGKVKNFTWSFNQDGSYDIELSIISLGDVIESLKSNLTPNIELLKDVQALQGLDLQTGDTSDEIVDVANQDSSPQNNVLSAYLLLQKINLIADNPRDWNDNPKYWYGGDIYYTIDGTTKPIVVWIKPKKQVKQQVNIDEYFLNYDNYLARRRELEEKYKEYFESGEVSYNSFYDTGESGGPLWHQISISGEITIDNLTVGNKDETKNICYFNYVEEDDSAVKDNGFYMRFGHLLDFLKEQCLPKNNQDGTPMFQIRSGMWSSRMIYYPNQISFDPRVCIVNGKMGDNTLFPQLSPWKNEAEGYAWTMNIYISFPTIQGAISSNLDEEGNLSIFSFLSSICTSINAALGGVNNLEPIMDEENNELRIIDDSYSADKKEPSYVLEMFGYNGNTSNFVRNIDLKTEITPEYASMVTIGATAGGYVKGTEATMFSKFNKGIKDRYAEKYNPPTSTSQNNPDEPRNAFFEQIYNGGTAMLGYKYIDVDVSLANPPDAAQLQNDTIDTNVAIATEYYKYLNAKAQTENPNFASPTLGFIPFNLGITLDGISGIKIYNEVNVSTRFLPKTYPNTLRFIIKGVTHKIQNQDWETSLETVVIPNTLKNKPQYELLVSLMNSDAANSSSTSTGGNASGASSSFSSTSSTSGGAPSTSQRGGKAERAGGGGVKTYGTLGANGDTSKLSKDALTIQGINTITADSGANSIIRQRIVKIAASYVGNQEALPPQNPGWWDEEYEAKFKTLKAYPWTKPQPWCAWFCQLVWKEAYTIGNKLVDNTNNLEYADFYKNTWKTTLKNGAFIGAGVSTCKNNFIGIKKFITLAEAKSGKYLPEPGDIAVYSYGHVDLVIKPFIEKGKLAGYSAIGGNTGNADARNGGETKYYSKKGDWQKAVGFCKVITPFNVNTQYR